MCRLHEADEDGLKLDQTVEYSWVYIPSGQRFAVGDKVRGYKFDGEVRAVLLTKSGDVRIVVEHADGWLHIFNEEQLVHDKA